MVGKNITGSYETAVKSMWDGKCDVYVRETVINPDNGRNEPVEKAIYTQIPCRLSFKSISSTSEQSEAATVQQVVKLFISKDIDIPFGSKLVVTQKEHTGVYTKSGDPAIYSFQQEIILEHFKEYA